jgi:hypothetical protein
MQISELIEWYYRMFMILYFFYLGIFPNLTIGVGAYATSRVWARVGKLPLSHTIWSGGFLIADLIVILECIWLIFVEFMLQQDLKTQEKLGAIC